MPVEHIHSRDDGLRLTSPARTVFDLRQTSQAESLESVIEQGLRRSLYDIPRSMAWRSAVQTWPTRLSRVRSSAVVEAHVAPTADSHPDIELRRALDAVGCTSSHNSP